MRFAFSAFTAACAAAITFAHGEPGISARDIVEFRHVDKADAESVSPDRRWFFIVTRHGDLAAGVNAYVIDVYGVDEVLKALRAGKDLRATRPHATATMKSSSNRPAVRDIQWSRDSKHLVFLGEQPRKLAQVFELDVTRGGLRQLSKATTDIVRYSYASGRLIYYAKVETAIAPPTPGFVVRDQSVLDILTGKPGIGYFTLQLYRRDAGGSDRALLSPMKAHSSPWNSGVWISPDGRYAVISRTIDEIPAHWERYRFFQRIPPLRPSAGRPAGDRDLIPQHVVVDLRTGRIHGAIDAPTGFFGIPAKATVAWKSDSSGFVIFNTRLPLSDVSPAEAERRAGTASIVEVDLASGRLTPIEYYELRSDALERPRITLFEMPDDRTIAVTWNDRTRVLYRRGDDGQWTRGDPSAAPAAKIELSVVQDPNTRPEIFVSDPATRIRAQLSDLNPAFEHRQRATVRAFNWQAANGDEWKGALLLPPGHEPGRRLPLILQTHGFDPNAYLLDGPDSTGAAAQVLANAGFAVLLISDKHLLLWREDEAQRYMAGYEAAVAALDKAGIADPGNVGITGFSRTFYHAINAAAFSSIRFKAVNVSDGIDMGYAGYLMSWNEPTGPLIRQFYEKMYGARPLSADFQGFVEKSAVFNTHRITAPVRIETTNRRGAAYRWEFFSRLKLEGKPVELYVMEDGVHSLVQPAHREETMQGLVDWFSFWMLSRENPERPEQNERWRELKRLP